MHEMAHLIEPTRSDRFIASLKSITPAGVRPAPSSTNCRWLQRSGRSDMALNLAKVVIDMVFDSTYHPGAVPPKAPLQAGARL